ncbi:MAG: CHAT domain-containing protein, partial [bacterium]
MRLPFAADELKERLQSVENARGVTEQTRRMEGAQRDLVSVQAAPAPDSDAIKQFGSELFEAILPADVRSCYRRSLDRAREQGKGLRLRLRFEAAELALLPWEFLYDAQESAHICLLNETPIIRYLELTRPPQPLTIEPPLRILGMVASPGDLPALDVAKEKQQMAAAIEHLTEAGYISLNWLDGQSWRDLQKAIRHGPWHIFHFIGHGGFESQSGEGLLALADENGNTHKLPASKLGLLLAGHDSMRLAILNACEGARASESNIFSSAGSVLIQRGIPAVVSMQYEITDKAALEFSRTFYDALADGIPIDASVTEARKAISIALDDSMEWGTPVLHMRSPDGRLFKIDVAGAIFQKAPPAPTAAPETVPKTATASVAATVPAPATATATDEVRRGLLILLNKVKQFWVDGVLEKSL